MSYAWLKNKQDIEKYAMESFPSLIPESVCVYTVSINLIVVGKSCKGQLHVLPQILG